MNKRSILMILFVFAAILLLLSACVRPTPGGSEEATATPETAVSEEDNTSEETTSQPEETTPGTEETEDSSSDTSSETTPPTASETTQEDTNTSDSETSSNTTDESSSDQMESETTAPEAEQTPSDTTENTENTPATETSESTGGSGIGTPPTQEVTHIVQPGENLYRVGLKYGYSWVVLAQYNGIANPNQIYVGQPIRIPPAGGIGGQPPTTPVPPDANYTYYVVQPGENLFRIGLKFNVSWILIAEANGLVNPNYLVPGQVLKIPTSGTVVPPPAQCTYLVQPGDTLFSVAARYGLSWQTLAAANNIVAPYIIYAGQTIVIPGCTG